MDKYIVDERTGWKYELVGDYYLLAGTRFEDADPEENRNAAPDVATNPMTEDAATSDRPAIGRFGRAHEVYLKRAHHHVYSQLVAEGRPGTYIAQIDEQANAMLDLLIRQMAVQEGITEQLKATDQMAWVAAMNSIRNRAEEIVKSELIYT